MEKSIQLQHIMLGVCYYPEQWPREMWQRDLLRMKAHGIKTVRVFEFAWSVIEPKDNECDFSLFDDFLGVTGTKRRSLFHQLH